MRIAYKQIQSMYLVDFFTIIYLVFAVLEIEFISSYKLICLLLFISWLTIAYLSDKVAFSKIVGCRALWILWIYIAIVFVYVMLFRGVVYGLKYVLSDFIRETPFLIAVYYCEALKHRGHRIQSIINLELAAFTFLCFNVLVLINADPNAARAMAAGTNEYQGYITGGGFQLAYMLALLIPVLMFAKKKLKKIDIALIVYFIYALIKCNYTIALLCLVLGIALIVYYRGNGKHKKIYSLFLLLICITGLLYIFRFELAELFIQIISPLFGDVMIGRRLLQFGELLQGTASEGNGALVRFDLYTQSINAFLQSPFVGVGYLTEFDGSTGYQYLGKHSEIFDGLGEVGGIYILYILYYIKSIGYVYRKKGSMISITVGIVLFIMKLLNPVSAVSISAVLYIFTLFIDQDIASPLEKITYCRKCMCDTKTEKLMDKTQKETY